MKWVTVQQLIYSPDHTAVHALSPGAARNDAIKYKLHYKWLLMQFHCKATGKFSPRLEWSHCQFTFNLTQAAKHRISKPKTCLSPLFIQLVTQTPRATSVSDQFTVHLTEWMNIRRLEQKRGRKNNAKWFYIIKYNSIGMNMTVRLAACVVLMLLCLWGHILKSGNMFKYLWDSPVADQCKYSSDKRQFRMLYRGF